MMFRGSYVVAFQGGRVGRGCVLSTPKAPCCTACRGRLDVGEWELVFWVSICIGLLGRSWLNKENQAQFGGWSAAELAADGGVGLLDVMSVL